MKAPLIVAGKDDQTRPAGRGRVRFVPAILIMAANLTVGTEPGPPETQKPLL